MFKETDYYDRKMNIWDCDKKIDLEKPAPQNLRYTNTIDTIIEFYKPVRSLLSKPIIFIGILTSNFLSLYFFLYKLIFTYNLFATNIL